MLRSGLLVAALVLLSVLPARAVELRIAAPALERTLLRQVFNQVGPKGQNDNRRYLRGDATKGCAVYADTPHVSFRHSEPTALDPAPEDRVVVSIKTHAKLGFGKSCFGIGVSFESEVSFIPEAEGESVGFRDARIEHLSANKEIDLLLEPFLSKRLPQEMKVNAANLMRTLLVRAPDSTGYTLTLTSLNLRSMHVEGDALLVDLDAAIKVD